MNNLTTFCRCALVAALLCLATNSRAARNFVSLDGQWSFRLDPKDEGTSQRWFSRATFFTNRVDVPGAWQAQGYGSESDKLWHHYEGKAWYQRELQLPKLAPGQRLFLCVGGVHRSAELWLNGIFLGSHLGYLSPFEFDLTEAARTNATATLAICVDGKQHWDQDCLTGCVDIIDAMFTPWGGIWGHVWLEKRDAAWLEDVFVQPRLSPPGCVVTARVAGDQARARHVRLEIRSGSGRRITAVSGTPLNDGAVRFETQIPNAKLWSCDSPNLYLARLELAADSARDVLDRVDTPFGVREIRVEGPHFYLNGQKLFLRGYGDDAIYPKTMAPPANKAFYLERLKLIKQYGFNFVRHHSHLLLPEYYEAADEVGMLISAEFPIAYREYYDKARGPALDLYESEWAAAIKRLRNHPSIFDWSMANEMYDSFPLAPNLYRAAKQLDPARLVIDSDGLSGAFLGPDADRGTLDFFSVQFDEFALPLDKPDKHRFAAVPKKPVVSHETANYVTVPRLDLIEEFKDNFKPFWLTPYRARLQKMGLLAEADQWSRNSERLYHLAHKLNLEDLRHNPLISGYTWWLFQDYWTGANGLVDAYFRPKSIPSAAVRRFNAPVVLLQEGLPLTARSSQPLQFKLLISNFSPAPIRAANLRWTVSLGKRTLAKDRLRDAAAPQGELSEAAVVRVTPPPLSQPEKLVISAELQAGGLRSQNDWYAWIYPARPADLSTNLSQSESDGLLPVPRSSGRGEEESSRGSEETGGHAVSPSPPLGERGQGRGGPWLLQGSRPQREPEETSKLPSNRTPEKRDSLLPSTLFASSSLLPLLRHLGAKPLPVGEPLPTRAVFVVRQPTLPMLQAVEAGASLVCLSPRRIFPAVPNRFKSAWWLGSDTDCNAGTVVYPHPATRAIAPDGWCDLGWYHLLEGAQAYLLDEVPFLQQFSTPVPGAQRRPDSSANPQPVLIRALDVHTLCRNKALLFEASVGRGSILVSGLRLEPNPTMPERDWLLVQLIQYAATFPQPKTALPASFLNQRIADTPVPEGPFLPGFARLLSTNSERADYPSYREASAPLIVCRQLEPGRSLEWETAPVPARWNAARATFVFSGGLGWKSQPQTPGFVLLVNGRELLTFDVASEGHTWLAPGGNARLSFAPEKNLPEDALGLFYLTVPADRLEPGKPCRLAVQSQGKDSRRWFGLNPYPDLNGD
ncbi:MAG TPA: sugar-binding domain-containing protein [Verrucomicrobiae bacterium]